MAREGYAPLLKKTRWCVLKRKEHHTGRQQLRLRGLLRHTHGANCSLPASRRRLRRISAAGHLSWTRHQIYIGLALEDQDVALRPLGDGLFEIHFGPLLLGWLDEPSATFTPVSSPPRSLRR